MYINCTLAHKRHSRKYFLEWVYLIARFSCENGVFVSFSLYTFQMVLGCTGSTFENSRIVYISNSIPSLYYLLTFSSLALYSILYTMLHSVYGGIKT